MGCDSQFDHYDDRPTINYPQDYAKAGLKELNDTPHPQLVQELKDSGERRHFTTGAVRDKAAKKGKMSLMPFVALFLISCIYEDGALKYEARNWEKGIPISVYVDSAMRHLAKYMDGLRDEPHLSMAGWNICCALWTAAKVYTGFLPKELNDLPHEYSELSQYEKDRLNTWYGKL